MMERKNNNRNIRITDRMLLLIEQQTGTNFTEKWEMLVTRCAWELPQKEKELQQLEEQIARKQRYLQELTHKAQTLSATINDLFPRVRALEDAIDRNYSQYKT